MATLLVACDQCNIIMLRSRFRWLDHHNQLRVLYNGVLIRGWYMIMSSLPHKAHRSFITAFTFQCNAFSLLFICFSLNMYELDKDTSINNKQKNLNLGCIKGHSQSLQQT